MQPAPEVKAHDAHWLTLGQIGSAQGIKGWLNVWPYTEHPDALLDQEDWMLVAPDGRQRPVKLLQGAPHRKGLRVQLEGIADRTAAEALRGWWVKVARTALPPPEKNEFYRDELVGLPVSNLEAVALGAVAHFVDLPTGPVMVVKGASEYWIPAVPKHLRKVDVQAGQITVDWPAELE